MSYKNHLFVLLVALLINALQFTSCQKENPIAPTPPIDSTTLGVYTKTGNFYCTKASSSGYSSSGQSLSTNYTADIVMPLSISNNYIYFGDRYGFRIDSATQTYFQTDTLPSGLIAQVSLAFFNNYDSVELHLSENYSGSGGGQTSFNGRRSQLLPSSGPSHSYNNNLEGNYTLTVHEKDTRTGLDTQYTTTLFVTHTGYQLSIGSRNFDTDVFHSYLNYDKYHIYTTHYDMDYSIYWDNDSLFYEVDSIIYPLLDSIHYSFSGTK